MFQCRAADPLEWWLLRQKWLLSLREAAPDYLERELGRCQRNLVALLKLSLRKRPPPPPERRVYWQSPRPKKRATVDLRSTGHNAHYYERDEQWAGGIPGKRIDPDLGKY